MTAEEEIAQLKQQLAQKEAETQALKKELQGLQTKSTLQGAIIETIEEVNEILATDPQGKKLLWTTGFPHNLKPEVAANIQAVVKKSRISGAIKKESLKF